MAGLDHSTSHKLVEELIAFVSPDSTRERANGIVTRIDKDGTIWVRFSGSSSDTPCTKSAVSVKVGDSVGIRVYDRRATIDSNYTSPATDDTTANKALETGSSAERVANRARELSEDAVESAGIAADAASIAEQAATEASENAAEVFGYLLDVKADWEEIEGYVESGGEKLSEIAELAETAHTDAENAARDAASANESARGAGIGLSEVERVVGTLNWIAEHGEYVAATETSPVEDRVYYTRTGTTPETYSYQIVTDVKPTDNPSSRNWYYLVINDSVQNYIASHLWLDNFGLNLTVDDNGYRIHQGTLDGSHAMGVYIINEIGSPVGVFNGDQLVLGSDGGPHITMTVSGQARMGLWENALLEVAYITNQELHISRTVVLNSMRVGNWQWSYKANGNLRLQWVG